MYRFLDHFSCKKDIYKRALIIAQQEKNKQINKAEKYERIYTRTTLNQLLIYDILGMEAPLFVSISVFIF